MTRADAYRRCLFAGSHTPLGKAVDAVRAWRGAGTLIRPESGRAYWRGEFLELVPRLYSPDDLEAACIVAVEEGVADAGSIYDRSPVPGFR